MKRAAIILSIISFLSASTINIPADYATIQAGINQSVDGDTVLVAEGIYYENLMINKEITLISTVNFESDIEGNVNWHDNQIINQTVVNGSVLSNPKKRSCLIVRDGDIQPTIKGFTFEGGVGTKMNIIACDAGGGIERSEFTGGGILVYDAYPTINYNRFVANGATPDSERGRKGSRNGGAIGHYEDAEVEFDEDRNETPIPNNSNVVRTVPGVMNIQNNYFKDNVSGNGQGFYSYGFSGSIDVSNSIFDNIDCETTTVNEYVLNSSENLADYLQDGISGACIEESAYYVATTGSDDNDGSESFPFQTITHALSFVKEIGEPTTIYVAAGTYSPDLTREIFPIVVPNNAYIIGENRETTILDANADASEEAAVIIIKEVEDVLFKNFTLVNGYSEGHECIGGGGLLVTSENMYNISEAPVTSTPVIENLIIENNWSHNGGGISFFLVDGPVLSNIIVRNNEATFHGGGIFIYVSNVVLSDVVVTENQNYGNPNYWNVGNGGGIMSVASGGDITNLTVTDNIGKTLGGGIFNMGSSINNENGFPGFIINGGVISGNQGYYGGGICFYGGSDAVLNDVEISSNYGENAGGGVHMDGATPTINNCLIKDNGSPEGGGVFAYGNSYPIIENSIIKDNVCDLEGGGVYYKGVIGGVIRNSLVHGNYSDSYTGGVSVQGAEVHIINSTITENDANTDGGVAAWGGGITHITNSIAWGNSDLGGTSSLTVWDGEINLYYSNTDENGWDGDQNLSIDPLFIDASVGDYGLQINSPCIDAGTTDLTTYHSIAANYYPGFSDIAEYQGAAPDMGAYETIIAVIPPNNISYVQQTSSVMLMWNDIAASYSYMVEKSLIETFSGGYVGQFIVEDNTFTDSDIEVGVEYFYRVSSIYGDVYSDPSEVISLMLVPTPTGLAITVQDDESVHLTWDNDDNATNYQIQRASSPMFFGSDLFYSTESNYNDTDITPGITNYYRVSALYGDYISSQTYHVSALVVPAPVGVMVTLDESTVTLSWDPVDIATVSYAIERATDLLFTSDIVDFTSTENSFVDNSVETDIEYFYRVSAVCCGGNNVSFHSEVVSAMLTPMGVDIASVPDAYSLHQNYPNPFNPTTQIRYGLKENTYVNIDIYNLMGKRVKSLVNVDQDAGYRSVYWDATNDLGQPVSAGMYIYTIQAGEFRQTKKMVLLK